MSEDLLTTPKFVHAGRTAAFQAVGENEAETQTPYKLAGVTVNAGDLEIVGDGGIVVTGDDTLDRITIDGSMAGTGAGYLKSDGTTPMTGNVDVGGNEVVETDAVRGPAAGGTLTVEGLGPTGAVSLDVNGVPYLQLNDGGSGELLLGLAKDFNMNTGSLTGVASVTGDGAGDLTVAANGASNNVLVNSPSGSVQLQQAGTTYFVVDGSRAEACTKLRAGTHLEVVEYTEVHDATPPLITASTHGRIYKKVGDNGLYWGTNSIETDLTATGAAPIFGSEYQTFLDRQPPHPANDFTTTSNSYVLVTGVTTTVVPIGTYRILVSCCAGTDGDGGDIKLEFDESDNNAGQVIVHACELTDGSTDVPISVTMMGTVTTTVAAAHGIDVYVHRNATGTVRVRSVFIEMYRVA